VLITFITILFTSLLAYSTVFGRADLPDDIAFLQVEGEALKESVGDWFGAFFWFIGAMSLFLAALGIVDYTSRLAADVLKTSYLKGGNESRMYFGLVWGLVAIGIVVLLIGFDQPLVLIVISACVGGVMMFVYSALLMLVNRRLLPEPIRVRGVRLAALGWSFALFGVLSVLTIIDRVKEL
jgi:hypothetical protein